MTRGRARGSARRADSATRARQDGKAPRARRPARAACTDSDDTALWWSPLAPAAGATIKLLAVGEESGAGELAAIDPAGARHALTVTRHRASPASLSAELTAPHAGAYRVTWTRGDKTLACRTIEVAAHAPKPDTAVGQGGLAGGARLGSPLRELLLGLDRRLFDAPPDASLDFRPLHQALRDPARNFLYDYLGLREDDPKNKAAIAATPDCADLPYFLRAYFSWKLGLPFGFRDCDRGTDARPPRCTSFFSNEDRARRARTRWRVIKSVPAPAGQPRAVGQRAHGARRRRHRLLPGARSSARRCGRGRSTPIPTAT